MLVVWIVRTNISLRIVSTQIVPPGTEGNLMDLRRWLLVGLCFCIFSGCKTGQSYYDYCGPMPDEGGDFMYRKNSVLGGDPAMKRIDEEATGEQGEPADETGPEPTPAPPPDEEPVPGMDLDGDRPTTAPETDGAAEEMGDEELELADEEPEPELGDDLGESPNDSGDEVAGDERTNSEPSSTTAWHAPSKNGRSPMRQVRFRAE